MIDAKEKTPDMSSSILSVDSSPSCSSIVYPHDRQGGPQIEHVEQFLHLEHRFERVVLVLRLAQAAMVEVDDHGQPTP